MKYQRFGTNATVFRVGQGSRKQAAILRRGVVAVAATVFCPALSVAGNFSFTSAMSDQAFTGNSRAEFTFQISADSLVTLETWSSNGGTNAAGEVIPSGGFDPIVSVFNQSGAWIASDDDGGDGLDSYQTLQLPSGDYLVVLTEYNSFPVARDNGSGTYADGFSENSSDDIASGYATANWALDILGVNNAAFLGLVDGGQIIPIHVETALPEVVASDPNAASVATAITSTCLTSAGSFSNEACADLFLAASSSNPALQEQAAQAVEVITPKQATAPQQASRISQSNQRNNIGARLVALRNGSTGLDVSGLAMLLGGQQAGFDSADSAAGLAPSGGGASADNDQVLAFADGRFGAFVNGNLSSGDKDATINERGFAFFTWGVTGGVDYRLKENLVVGVAGGYTSNGSSIDQHGGSLDASTWNLSAYGTFYQGQNLYVDGIASYGHTSYDQKRNINYQLGNQVASQTALSSYGGHNWLGSLGAGYTMSKDAWTFGPEARIEYINTTVNSYSERMSNPSGYGGSWASSLSGSDQQSFTTTIGGMVSRAISTTWGVVSPQLNLGWVHQFKNNALTVNGAFVQNPGALFNIASDRPDTDYFTASLGATAQFAGGTSAFARYDTVVGYRDLTINTLWAGVTLAF